MLHAFLQPLHGMILDSAPSACADDAAVDASGPIALRAHLVSCLGLLLTAGEGSDSSVSSSNLRHSLICRDVAERSRVLNRRHGQWGYW